MENNIFYSITVYKPNSQHMLRITCQNLPFSYSTHVCRCYSQVRRNLLYGNELE